MSRLTNKKLDMLIDLHQDKYLENIIDYNVSLAVKELKEYRDLEEQGLLLKLPCKVGDKAYYVNKGHIDEVEIDSFVLNINLFVNVSYYIGCERFGKTLTPYKTLFFTKEEAEQELKEMEDAE